MVSSLRYFSSYCRSNARLAGKTVVITGANCGIGKETARDLYKRGARVILACRDVKKAEEAVNDIKQSPAKSCSSNSADQQGQLEICYLNLSSFASIRKCAQHLSTTEPKIHILINNAGVFFHPFEITEDGFETHLQVNHLGHFLLTLLLLPRIQQSTPGCRIINLSSKVYMFADIDFDDLNLERSFSPRKGYSQSKLANILFSNELSRQLKASAIHDINVYSVHPGVVKTELGRHINKTMFRGARSLMRFITPLMKTAEQGAQTSIHCAVDEQAGSESGLYYADCKAQGLTRKAADPELAKQFWKRTCELLNLPSDLGLNELSSAASNQKITEA